MYTIHARNVNDAYNGALWCMKINGQPEDSRNGAVLAVSEPVATVYAKPLERMLFDPDRNANPFFHIMEAMWMLAGRNDLASLTPYNARMSEFSDDGVTLAGAYGHRWKNQLSYCIKLIRDNPETRRAVLALWTPGDLVSDSKDKPCNTTVYFRPLKGELHMTVCCRSNDIIWGCYGANVVHFSYLLEYMAISCGLRVGTYTQISNNWHIYERHYHLMVTADTETVETIYNGRGYKHFPLMGEGYDPRALLRNLNRFFGNPYMLVGDTPSSYINAVLIPLRMAWESYKKKFYVKAFDQICLMGDEATRKACILYILKNQKP